MMEAEKYVQNRGLLVNVLIKLALITESPVNFMSVRKTGRPLFLTEANL